MKKRRGRGVGRIIEVHIAELSDRWEGLAELEGGKVHVPNTFVGDRVRARVISRRGPMRRALREEILEASPLRVEPPCEVADRCGGCPLMALAPETQRRLKVDRLRGALLGAGLAPEVVEAAMLEPLGDERVLGYRSKALFPVARREDGRLIAGLYEPHSHDLVPIESCPVQGPIVNRILPSLIDLLRDERVAPWEEASESGTLRWLLLRESFAAEEALVGLVTAGDLPEGLGERVAELHPSIAGVLEVRNEDAGNRAVTDDVRLLAGRDHLIESVAGVETRVTLTGFSQVNPGVASLLVAEVMEALQPAAGEGTLLDVYAGAAPFGLALAGHFGAVLAIEADPVAAEAARAAAQAAGLTRFEVSTGRAEDALALIPSDDQAPPAAAIVDPPRKGLVPEALTALVATGVGRIALVSCAPVALARDLAELNARGYRLERLRPVELFPQTHHLEVVATLVREDVPPSR